MRFTIIQDIEEHKKIFPGQSGANSQVIDPYLQPDE